MKQTYGHVFYRDRHKKTVYAAKTVSTIVLDSLPAVDSAIDFGCGVGTWLSVLKEMGVHKIQGVDGPWVDQQLLEIPAQNFQQADFEDVIFAETKYDLAIALEVAEHLPEKSAANFVDSLTNSSDFILFSAAIPFQGGGGHINEQWPDYWGDLFAKKGYVAIDFVRTKIWNDRDIPVWYRQNILLFVKEGKEEKVKVPNKNIRATNNALSVVHPEVYISKLSQTTSIKGTWKLFNKAIKTYIKGKIDRRSV